MVILVGYIVVERPRIAEMPLLPQSALTEDVERAVNRGQADPYITGLDLAVKVLGRYMVFSKKDLENDLSLASQFEAVFGQVPFQYFDFALQNGIE